jgi:hypothetical protein
MEFHELSKNDPPQWNCTIKKVDEKGKEQICNGQLKEWMTAPASVRAKAPSGATLFRCRRCGAVYYGTPRSHLRPAGKQATAAQPSLPTQFPVIR